ncbi:MAG: M23 family metallopeptidase [Candidatus Krumholzibacteriia bacterium]
MVIGILTTYLIVPLLFIYWVWKWRATSAVAWLSMVLGYGFFFTFLWVSGPWAFINYYLRYLYPSLFVIAVARSARRRVRATDPARASWRSWVLPGVNVVLLVVFGVMSVVALAGYRTSDEPVQLAFPLRNGAYAVVHGGNSVLINYHNAHKSQRYALDISKLNAAGFRAAGWRPRELTAYAIFGDTLYCPCDGTVEEVVRDLPDHTPPERDRKNVAGNYVLVDCGGIDVYLAHMMKASAQVRPGERVVVGQAIGRVGNSGNTTEPHLHIHAERGRDPGAFSGGDGVPIRFDGRFLVRNSLVRRVR